MRYIETYLTLDEVMTMLRQMEELIDDEDEDMLWEQLWEPNALYYMAYEPGSEDIEIATMEKLNEKNTRI